MTDPAGTADPAPADPSLPYRYHSIEELGAALRGRRVSAVELARHAIDGLARLAAPLNGVAQLLHERAAAEARGADESLRSGAAGPLCGIPYAAKDIFAAKGGRTTWGSSHFAGQRFESDAAAVRRLSRAGAVLAAKVSTVELAGAGRPARWGSSLQGQGVNPWDHRRYSGGSSSGPGIAVGLGVVPFALATETGGSILAPSAFCGVTGLRPTYGRVPTGGVMRLSPSLDKVGVLARSAADCAAVLSAIAPRRPRNGASRVRPVVGIPRGALSEVEPSMQPVLGQAIAELGSAAARIEEIDLWEDVPFASWLETIMNVESSWEFSEQLDNPAFTMSDARALSALREARRTPAIAYLGARRGQEVTFRLLRDLFRRIDYVIAPAQPRLPPRLHEPAGPRTSATASEVLKNAGNLAGIPAVAFPCGLTGDGVPVGMQLVGPRGSDESMLGLVGVYQRGTSWHDLRPPDDPDGQHAVAREHA